MPNMNRYGLLTADEQTLAEGHHELLAGHANAVTERLEMMEKTIARVNADPHLTPKGKGDKVAKIRQATHEVIESVTAPVRAKLSDDLNKAKANVPTQLSRPRPQRLSDDLPDVKLRHAIADLSENLLGQQREAEIRAHLMKLDPAIREGEIHTAAQAGDLDLLLAAEHAPAVLRLADKSTLDGARDKYFRAKHPEAFAQLDAVNAAVGTFAGNERTIQRITNVRPDPVKVAAQNTDTDQ